MTSSIIITICSLLLLAYVFDISAKKTKIPAVILLLLLGWAVKQATIMFNISVPDLTTALPVLGTVGLTLIVLEGALELDLNQTKLGMIGQYALIALLPMLLLSFGLAYAFHYYGSIPYKYALANAIPYAVISSAIAIPSAKGLIPSSKAFITYESSLSDIFGVILFNFITLNETIEASTFAEFFMEIAGILVVSFLATILLAFLLSKIKHHVKFAPIILIILLVYTVAKTYHLPALVFILLFGLFLSNLDELKSLPRLERFNLDTLQREVLKFKELTTEFTFLIRSLFFLIFGFFIKTDELFNQEMMMWSLGITSAIFLIRFVFLAIFRLPLRPLLFLSPRGLITILLYISIPAHQLTPLSNNSVIIQVVILSALMMMIGLMTQKRHQAN